MPTYPDRAKRPHPLQWFALSIAGGFFLSFFVYWVFAALLALSLGAVATGFARAREDRRISAWLVLPAPGVFAFVIGSFFHGFAYQAEVSLRGRIVMGVAEVGLMTFTGGETPLEGAARISPWGHVAVSWVALSAVALFLNAWIGRHRPRP